MGPGLYSCLCDYHNNAIVDCEGKERIQLKVCWQIYLDGILSDVVARIPYSKSKTRIQQDQKVLYWFTFGGLKTCLYFC